MPSNYYSENATMRRLRTHLGDYCILDGYSHYRATIRDWLRMTRGTRRRWLCNTCLTELDTHSVVACNSTLKYLDLRRKDGRAVVEQIRLLGRNNIRCDSMPFEEDELAW